MNAQKPIARRRRRPGSPVTPSRPSRAIASRPRRPSSHARAEQYVVRPLVTDFDAPMSTDFFDGLGRLRAEAVPSSRAPAVRTLAQARGYRKDDLHVIADMATNYLFNGGLRLAVTLFEGLVAVAPDEPYYAMGLGLTYDRMGNAHRAAACYRAAARLDPSDGRPDVNLAELELRARRPRQAVFLLRSGLKKALARDDSELGNKAAAILRRITNASSQGRLT